jgi:hypothetical protein
MHARARRLAVGSADPWHGDFHPVSAVPCLAHTPGMSRALRRVGSMPWFGLDRVNSVALTRARASRMGVASDSQWRGFGCCRALVST